MDDKNKIRFGTAISGAGVTNSAPSYDYSHLLGKQFLLRGVGENSEFDQFLPRKGKGLRQIAIEDWGTDWMIIQFDEPFNYTGYKVEYCLIRGRWSGHPIGSEFCPVFVLTDPQNNLAQKNQWTNKDFEFISWGEIILEKS